MRPALIRTLSACGVGMLIHGKLSAAANYRLSRQCYELAGSGEVVSSCATLPGIRLDTFSRDPGMAWTIPEALTVLSMGCTVAT